jgi:hypothetical protein
VFCIEWLVLVLRRGGSSAAPFACGNRVENVGTGGFSGPLTTVSDSHRKSEWLDSELFDNEWLITFTPWKSG